MTNNYIGTTDNWLCATDGSCIGNPGKTGWAWVIDRGPGGFENDTSDDAVLVSYGSMSKGTNNIGELAAIEGVLCMIPAGQKATILVDSQYSIDATTKWANGWKRNGWKTKAGNPVKNRELIESITELLDNHPNVSLVKTKAHESWSSTYNVTVDHFANYAARNQDGGMKYIDRSDLKTA